VNPALGWEAQLAALEAAGGRVQCNTIIANTQPPLDNSVAPGARDQAMVAAGASVDGEAHSTSVRTPPPCAARCGGSSGRINILARNVTAVCLLGTSLTGLPISGALLRFHDLVFIHLRGN
jgi:hypothetical protein